MGALNPARARGLHHRLYDWVLHWAAHRHAQWALFVMAVAEASFFPIPPDVLLMAMGFARPRRAPAYAGIATAGSVLGGLAGYGIGYGLWHLLAPYFFKYLRVFSFTVENFEKVQRLYQDNAFFALFTAGFTPIPYKIFTIAAGVFEVALPVFVLASILGRAGRFFIVGILVWKLGPRVRPFVERYLGWLTLAFVVLLGLGFWAVGRLGH